jgi:hypothetical protein
MAKGHKSTKANLKRDTSTLEIKWDLEGVDGQEGRTTCQERNEKWRREKEATCVSFIDLTERDIETEESNAQTNTIEAETKLLAEENRIILAGDENMTHRVLTFSIPAIGEGRSPLEGYTWSPEGPTHLLGVEGKKPCKP